MTSNLLLAFNKIALDALDITTTNATSDFYPIHNLISNSKSAWVTFESSVTTNTFKFDLGWDGAANITSVADFFAFPAQYIDTSNSYSVDLEASNDDSIWITILNISEADLIADKDGYFGQDYLDTFTETSSYRYWRIVVTDDTASNAFSGAFSKFFIGSLFDMGCDPDKIDIIPNNPTRFKADFGSKITQQGNSKPYDLSITWTTITDQKVIDFEELFFKQKEQLIYLYAENNNHFLSGNKIVSFNISKYDLVRHDNMNEISLDLTFAV